jgi:hypothetical protein
MNTASFDPANVLEFLGVPGLVERAHRDLVAPLDDRLGAGEVGRLDVLLPPRQEILGLLESVSLEQRRIVGGVVGHHDERRAGLAPDEKTRNLVRREARRTPHHLEATLAQPVPDRVEQSRGHGGVVDALEEPEEADGLFVELLVTAVPNRADAADGLGSTQGEERLSLGMQVKRVLRRVERVPHVQLQRRNPVGVVSIHRPREVDELLQISTRVDRNHPNGCHPNGCVSACSHE